MCPTSVLFRMVDTGHMWLLSISNVASVTFNLILINESFSASSYRPGQHRSHKSSQSTSDMPGDGHYYTTSSPLSPAFQLFSGARFSRRSPPELPGFMTHRTLVLRAVSRNPWSSATTPWSTLNYPQGKRLQNEPHLLHRDFSILRF